MTLKGDRTENPEKYKFNYQYFDVFAKPLFSLMLQGQQRLLSSGYLIFSSAG